MEHRVAYNELSEQARQAWETINGLPLTTSEQHLHAWEVLRAQLACLADDPQPGLHVVSSDPQAVACELYISGAELAALRVMVAWLKANDRAGRVRDLPVYPELAEAIVGQLGEMPWVGVWEPSYLDHILTGGTLVLHLRTTAPALAHLLEATLRHTTPLCPGWSPADRDRLQRLLCDVWYWLHAMLAVHTP